MARASFVEVDVGRAAGRAGDGAGSPPGPAGPAAAPAASGRTGRAGAARCPRPTGGWSRRARTRRRCGRPAESISASSWLTVLRMLLDVVRCERLWPSASTSSKNSTQGALRRAAAKICGQVALAAAGPHVQHVGHAELGEPGADLAGHRPGDEGLAAAGRAVEQQPAAGRRAERRGQLRVADRAEERQLQPLLDVLHAADVGQPGRRPLGPVDVLGDRGRRLLARRPAAGCRAPGPRPAPSRTRPAPGRRRLAGGASAALSRCSSAIGGGVAGLRRSARA